MRYWNFDICQLIADYEQNRRVLLAVQREMEVCQAMIENPLGTTTSGDWEQMMKVLRLREEEYSLYVGMVVSGLEALPEVERNVLKMWLLTGTSDEDICYKNGIVTKAGDPCMSELKKIKKLAITRFMNIVMP